MEVKFILAYIAVFLFLFPLFWRMVPGIIEICEDLVNFWMESWDDMFRDAQKAFKKEPKTPKKKQALSESLREIDEICSYIKETFLLRITPIIVSVITGITKFLKRIMGV